MKMLWKLIEVIKDCDSKGRYTSTVARFAKKQHEILNFLEPSLPCNVYQSFYSKLVLRKHTERK